MLSFHTHLYIDCQWWKSVLVTKMIFPSCHIWELLRVVLYMSGKVIHFALKYSMRQRGEKWGVISYLHPLLQIGSNFVPLIHICLFLFVSLSLSTSYMWLWSQHPLPSRGLEHHISVSKDEMRETERGRDEFSGGHRGNEYYYFSVFKMPSACWTLPCYL